MGGVCAGTCVSSGVHEYAPRLGTPTVLSNKCLASKTFHLSTQTGLFRFFLSVSRIFQLGPQHTWLLLLGVFFLLPLLWADLSAALRPSVLPPQSGPHWAPTCHSDATSHPSSFQSCLFFSFLHNLHLHVMHICTSSMSVHMETVHTPFLFQSPWAIQYPMSNCVTLEAIQSTTAQGKNKNLTEWQNYVCLPTFEVVWAMYFCLLTGQPWSSLSHQSPLLLFSVKEMKEKSGKHQVPS
jgi:hypothetical protein